ncbi:MAG: N-acetyltransferase family protein [Candidatus Malihini olakiniferum]
MDIIEAEEQYITAIQKIYAYHVIHGTASFETDPLDIKETFSRLKKKNEDRLPWFIAIKNGRLTAVLLYVSLPRAPCLPVYA